VRIGDRVLELNGRSVDGGNLPAILNSLGSDAQYTIPAERNGVAFNSVLRNAVSVDGRQIVEVLTFLFVSLALYAAAMLLSSSRMDAPRVSDMPR
jgi:hypothetical protein